LRLEIGYMLSFNELMEQNSLLVNPPPFFSSDFHFRFFPRLIKYLVFEKGRDSKRHGSGFSSVTEYMVIFVAAVISLLGGLPSALGSGSLMGYIFSIAGGAGIIALFVMSIAGQSGYKPTYDGFRIFTFLFCVFLGITCGMVLGHALDSVYFLKGLLAITGMAGGYVAGIFAGLWIQRLGWIEELLNVLAGLCVVSFIVLDLIMLV